MSLDDPVVDSGRKHADSIECTANLTQQILENGADLMQSIELDCKRKAAVRQRHEASLKVKADDLQRHLPETQHCAMAQACEKGGSSRLTTIPVAEHGFFFDAKADFHDHVHLRYCWPLDNLPLLLSVWRTFHRGPCPDKQSVQLYSHAPQRSYRFPCIMHERSSQRR